MYIDRNKELMSYFILNKNKNISIKFTRFNIKNSQINCNYNNQLSEDMFINIIQGITIIHNIVKESILK